MTGDVAGGGAAGRGPVEPDRADLGDDEAVHGSPRWRAAALRQLPYYVQVFEGPDHVNVGESDQAVALYGGQQGVGRRIADYLTGAEGQGLVEMLDRVYAGERLMAPRVRFVVVTDSGPQEVFADIDFLPLRDASGEVVGSVAAGHDVTEQVRVDREQAAEAAELARRYRRATDVVAEVQRALLPSRLPVLPGVDLAATYVVGDAEQAAGGDWFDVLPRPDGTVAAVVGDVVGHGVAASAVMSQLRAVTLERLHAGAGPAEVVAVLDRFTDVVPGARSATVCVLLLDPAEGTVEHCSAGHPPPLVVSSPPPTDGSAAATVDGTSHAGGAGAGGRYLAAAPAPPLGTGGGAGPDRVATTDALAPDELVLLYTDGVLERPGVAATAATVELARTAADALVPAFTLPSAVDRVTTQTLERLTRFTGSTDDITLLALRPVAPLEPLHLTVDLTRAGLPAVRAAVRGWLGPDRVDPRSVDQLDEIVSELCENVVDHAYPGTGGGPLALTADLDHTGQVTLTVADRGRWRAPQGPASGRGLGLAIAQHLADHLRVDHADEGTTVTATYRPWKASHGSTPVTGSGRAEPELFDVHPEHHDDRALVKVRGPVDAAATPELDAVLALEVIPGRPLLVVDLDRVTLLGSSAVHALRRTLAAAGAAGVTVELRAAPGTVAHHVLSLVGLAPPPAAG